MSVNTKARTPMGMIKNLQHRVNRLEKRRAGDSGGGTTVSDGTVAGWLDDPDALTHAAALRLRAPADAPNYRRLGPISPDFTAVTPGAGADVSYNQAYVLGATSFPVDWPMDMGPGNTYVLSSFATVFEPMALMQRTLSVMCDGDKAAFYINGTPNHQAMVYVDGAPTSLTGYTIPTGNTYLKITFPSAKTRLIQVKTTSPVSNVYCAKPYRMWLPTLADELRVLVVGDSWVAPVIWNNAAATANYGENGAYQQIDDLLGTSDVWLDGVGGTGYGDESAPGANNSFLDRLANYHTAIQPDLWVVHGGGANDLEAGRTVAQVIADATSYFTQARAARPYAKLVFVEGFAPPLAPYNGYNADYITIRQALQTALVDVGVYYIDVATTAPWIDGTGYFAHTTGVGNGDVYIGNDGIHLNVNGHAYLRGRIAPKLRRIIADDGTLVNTLL